MFWDQSKITVVFTLTPFISGVSQPTPGSFEDSRAISASMPAFTCLKQKMHQQAALGYIKN